MSVVKIKRAPDDAIRRGMVRYRKVSVQMWSDEKFRALSPQPPSGQGLWQHLLTGPHTTPIPGLSAAGRAQLAERLGWKQRDFDRCWHEVEQLEMGHADWTAGVVWLPKAIEHNEPENPNVVKGWVAILELIPACPLKDEAITAIGAWLREHRPQWPCPAPFGNPLANPSGNPLPKGSTNGSVKSLANQEQEQEQEVPPKAPRVVRTKRADLDERFREWYGIYPRKVAPDRARIAYRAAATKTTPDALLAALKVQLPGMRRREYERIPHPSTWLTGGYWASEEPPNPSREDDPYETWPSLFDCAQCGGAHETRGCPSRQP